MAEQGERKKSWTKRELLDKADKCATFHQASDEICLSMMSGNIDMEDMEIAERFLNTSRTVAASLGRLVEDRKKRKFRHHPSQLDQVGLSASQHSIFQSQSNSTEEETMNSSLDLFSQDMAESLDQPTIRGPYKKRPLSELSRAHARRRVVNERETLQVKQIC